MPLPDGLINPSDIIASGASGGLWGWAALSVAALTTSLVMLTFIYVWGSLFRNPQLNAYVKAELYELVATAVMIPLIFSLVWGMSDLKIGTFLPVGVLPADMDSTTNIYDATAFFFQKVHDDMGGWLNMNYVLNIYIDQTASVTPYARPLGVGLVTSPLAGFATPIKQLLYNMSVALSVAFIINQAQLMVYIFSIQAFLKYYLPAGIFLRSFTPTRRLGGTLIGVALSFLFIFPLLSTISYIMLYNRDSGPLVSFGSLLGQYFSDVSPNGLNAKFEHFFGNKFTDIGSSVSGLIGGAFGSIGSVLETLVGGTFLMILIFPISIVSWAFAIGFVVPAFNLMIFTYAAKGLSKSFGEEVDISSLTRMI